MLQATDEQSAITITDPETVDSHLRFVKNEGQWEDVIQYRVSLNGGNIFFENNRLTYHLILEPQVRGHGFDKPKAFGFWDQKVQHHVFRMEFIGANPSPELVAGKKHTEYHNYFLGNDPSKWAGGVPLYGLLTYKDIYPGIDLRFYGVGDVLKYDFIVHPGADPDLIQVAYPGLTDIQLKKQAIVLNNSVRKITEMPPVAYQTGNQLPDDVACKYELKEGVVRYHFPKSYDDSRTLIIDPTLVFVTYSGSVSNNWGFTATYDEDGNAYGGGIQRDATVGAGYPTTTGAFQTTFLGGISDVTISKFSTDGTALLYSTFLGGPPGGGFLTEYHDQPHSMIVTPDNELVVFGRTNSPSFPTTTGAYDETANGNYDIFVTKFTDDGTGLIGSTLIGGSGSDGVNGAVDPSTFTNTKYNYGDDSRGEVILDGAGNIYIAGSTLSQDFPMVGNGFQTSNAGNQDGCIVKLNANLTNVIWSSYIGGGDDDAAYTIKLDGANNVFVAGGTESDDMPISNGVNTTYHGGDADGYVVRINNAGTTLLNGTYLGTDDYDQVYLLDLDRLNDIYVVGQTEGTYPTVDPPAGPVYSNNGSKQFITKLSNDLSSISYSTNFGSNNSNRPNISPTALLVDRCDNVYVTGWGGSTNQHGSTSGMPVSSDGNSTTDGSDFYTIVLSRDAQQLVYGSYFHAQNSSGTAGDHVDGGTSRFDKNGIVYHAVCAGCWGVSPFTATPGAYSATNKATTPSNQGCNLLVFKLAFDLEGIQADFDPLDEMGQTIINDGGCAPFTATFDNLSDEGMNPGDVSYLWDFGDAGATATDFEPTHTYNDPGLYTVQLIITDSTSCNIADTVYKTIEVYPPPVVDAGEDVIGCLGDTVILTSQTIGVSYQWSPVSLVVGASNVPNPSVIVSPQTSFVLTLTDTNGCEGMDTVLTEVDTTFRVIARLDTTICIGETFSLGATTTGVPTFFSWTSVPPANISNPAIPNPSVTNLDTTTVFYVISEDTLGCRSIDSVMIEVFEVLTLEDTFVCDGGSIVLASTNGASFTWTPDDGSLTSTTIPSPTATPLTTTTYSVTAVSVNGCISTKSILVEVKPNPQATVSGPQAICVGDTAQLEASGGLTYQWSPFSGLSDPGSNSPMAYPGETTNYILTVFDQFGCQDQAEVVVTVNPLPVVLATGDGTICEGESQLLQATGATTYSWSPGASLSDPNSSAPIASPIESTAYVVTGVDQNGCEDTDSLVLEVVPRPVTDILGINFCEEESIQLTASGGETYLWSTGETTETISVFPTTPTLYIATASVGGCEGIPDSALVDNLFGYPEASFNFSPNTGFAPVEVTFQNTTTGGNSYLWQFGFGPISREENPVTIFPSAGTYDITLIVSTDQNCMDTVVQQIVIDNVTLHAPSAFSPNADGSNDLFYIGYVGIQTLTVKIFSRWGHKIYESDNPNFQWDGTYKTEKVPEGVYVYVIQGLGENDLRYERVGTVTLIR